MHALTQSFCSILHSSQSPRHDIRPSIKLTAPSPFRRPKNESKCRANVLGRLFGRRIGCSAFWVFEAIPNPEELTVLSNTLYIKV